MNYLKSTRFCSRDTLLHKCLEINKKYLVFPELRKTQTFKASNNFICKKKLECIADIALYISFISHLFISVANLYYLFIIKLVLYISEFSIHFNYIYFDVTISKIFYIYLVSSNTAHFQNHFLNFRNILLGTHSLFYLHT